MNISSLSDLLHDQLKDLRNAESQLTKALPKLANRASSPMLQQALSDHLDETLGQLERLSQIGESLGLSLSGKRCKAMEGLIEEGGEVLKTDVEGIVADLAIIAAAQRVKHYEIAAYGTARELATQLRHFEVAELLQATLEEEGTADKKLTQVALELYPVALEFEEGSESNNEEASADSVDSPTMRKR